MLYEMILFVNFLGVIGVKCFVSPVSLSASTYAVKSLIKEKIYFESRL